MSIYWPLQTPVDCWIIHFVYKYNQMLYSSSFGQHGMLSCLASFLKACFKLSFPCRDYLQREIMTITTGAEVNGKTNRQQFLFSQWQSMHFESDICIQTAPSTVTTSDLLTAQQRRGFFHVDISHGSPSVPIQHYDSPALPNRPVKHHQSCWAQSFCGPVHPEW